MLRLLLIVIAFILYGSLYPFHFDFDRTQTSPLWILLHALPAKFDRFAWRDAGVRKSAPASVTTKTISSGGVTP